MNKRTVLSSLGLLLGLAAPLALPAQTSTTSTSRPVPTEREIEMQSAGTREFTLGAGGATNKDFDDSQGAAEFAYGSFLSPLSELTLRQSIVYVNPDNGDSSWNGSTRLAYDYHFNSDNPVRPFVGVSGGRIYGDAVNDSWTAGVEVGSKFFVQSRTFIYAVASYDWLFDRGSQLDDRFDDGRIGWNVGIGYQF
jgi:hypothetical protein